MSFGGDSLNRYHLQGINANSQDDLINQLNSLRIEYSILSINTVGSNWYATLSLSRPINNLNEQLKKVNKNGSTKK